MEAGSAAAGGQVDRGVTGSTELARNALGLPQVLFCIVTGAAPLAAMIFNDPLGGLGFGIAVPAGFWIATVAFTFFSVGYVEMARRVTTAGGIYSYMSYGLRDESGTISSSFSDIRSSGSTLGAIGGFSSQFEGKNER